MSDLFVPGTVKPEEDYEELGRLSRKLGIPVPMCFVTVESRMPDGTPHERYHDRSRTWVRNFWNKMFHIVPTSPFTDYTGIFGAGHLNVITTSGAIASLYNSQVDVIGNNDTYGIVVGNGTLAENFESYQLDSKITSGNISGKLLYSTQNASTYTYTSGTKLWSASMVRLFNNNSGGSITITETAIYVYFGGYYMFCRDVLAASVTVANGGQLTVTYTILLTFPA